MGGPESRFLNSSEITRNEGRPWRALEQGPWRVPGMLGSSSWDFSSDLLSHSGRLQMNLPGLRVMVC